MVSTLGKWLNTIAKRIMPDPFVLAILLLFVTIISAIFLTDTDVFKITQLLYEGFFSIMAFTYQMIFILVTGYLIASSDSAKEVFIKISAMPKTEIQAVIICAAFSMLLGLINWGLSLIAGAFLAREMSRFMLTRGKKVHYPLMAAGGYLGLMVWHGGLSGSAPLLMAQKAGRTLMREYAQIPLTKTVLSTPNLAINLVVFAVVIIIISALYPADVSQIKSCEGYCDPVEPGNREKSTNRYLTSILWIFSLLMGTYTVYFISHNKINSISVFIILALFYSFFIVRLLQISFKAIKEDHKGFSLVERLETSRFLIVFVSILFIVGMSVYLYKKGLNLGLNQIIFLFLIAGLLLHEYPKKIVDSITEAASGTGGIIIQFPIYGAILGIMKGSGLIAVLSKALLSVSGRSLLPLFSFISAAIVNLFVPSGGGQWAVQGPIFLDAFKQAGLGEHLAIMSLAYGDQITNMLQPFWALPLLAVTGLKARDIVGYSATIMIFAGLVFAIGLYFY